ncbi:Aste57867_3521 [Aphanomyces stellatus]|uniref:Aste57867_3521 protein n=1 Tax=Aphanomyces stellatus TaxID=120398 RepID=A0A485KAX7_9STRA|nr:hypothetical protein As57867_003510 [Aphanomyces stellatus]VFT80684.1 Aste57867_3521 [Aphanomyces stellatus]
MSIAREPTVRAGTRRLSSIVRQALGEVQWSQLLARPLLGLCLVQHFLCGIYFAVIGILMHSMTEYEVALLRAWNPRVSAIACFVVALLHVVPFVRLVRHVRSGATKHRASASAAWLRFSIPMLGLTHVTEVVCESYLAYRMSTLSTTGVAYAYAVCVTLNCWFTPWLLFLRLSGIKHMLVDFVDCLISFLLCTGIPLVAYIIPLVQYKFGTVYLGNSFDWIAVNVPVTRHLVVDSPLDLVVILVPNLSNYLILWRIVGRLHVQLTHSSLRIAPSTSRRLSIDYTHTNKSTRVTPTHGTDPDPRRRGKLSVHLLADHLGLFFTSNRHLRPSRRPCHRPRLLKAILVFNLVWGLAVLCVATASTFLRQPCPSSCLRASSPWGTLHCNCIYLRVHCVDQGIVHDDAVDMYIQAAEVGFSLLVLLVKACAIPRGLDAATLAQFPSLFAFRLENTSMTSWDIPSSSFNQSVMIAQITQSALDHIPSALFHPHPFSGLYISSSPLGTIPDSVWPHWQQLTTLWLANNQLSAFPAQVLTMASLGSLGLELNNIPSLPSELANMPSLFSLHVDANAITNLPLELLRDKPKLALYADFNPIATLPLDEPSVVAALVAHTLTITSTPFCSAAAANRLTLPFDVALVCPPNCAVNCTRFAWGNFMCTKACNNAACAFDKGDCTLDIN